MATFDKCCCAVALIVTCVNISITTCERPREVEEAVEEMGAHDVVKYSSDSGVIVLTCHDGNGEIDDRYTWKAEGGRTLEQFMTMTNNKWQTVVSNNGRNLTVLPDNDHKVHRVVFYCIDGSGNVVNVIDFVRHENTELFRKEERETQCPLFEGYHTILSCAGHSRRPVTNCSWEHRNQLVRRTHAALETTTALVLGVDVEANQGRYTCRCNSGKRIIERDFNVPLASSDEVPRDSFFCRQIAQNTNAGTTTTRPKPSPTTEGPRTEAMSSSTSRHISTTQPKSTEIDEPIIEKQTDFKSGPVSTLLQAVLGLARSVNHLEKVGRRVSRSVGLEAPPNAYDNLAMLGDKSYIESRDRRSLRHRRDDTVESYLQMKIVPTTRSRKNGSQ